MGRRRHDHVELGPTVNRWHVECMDLGALGTNVYVTMDGMVGLECTANDDIVVSVIPMLNVSGLWNVRCWDAPGQEEWSPDSDDLKDLDGAIVVALEAIRKIIADRA